MIVSNSTKDTSSSHKLQNGILNPFWEIKIVLVETNGSVIRMVEKILENTKVLHFLRRVDNTHDLHFELVYNKPDLILTGRTMEEFSALDVLNLTKEYALGLPVIVLAPDYNEETNFELIDNGAYDIIFHQEIKRLPNEVTFLSEAYKRRKRA
jgi:DNA-binding NtrC family response regulator